MMRNKLLFFLCGCLFILSCKTIINKNSSDRGFINNPHECDSPFEYLTKNLSAIAPVKKTQNKCNEENNCIDHNENYEHSLALGVTVKESYIHEGFEKKVVFTGYTLKEVYTFASKCDTAFKGQPFPPKKYDDDKSGKLSITKVNSEIKEIEHYLADTGVHNTIISKQKDGKIILFFSGGL